MERSDPSGCKGLLLCNLSPNSAGLLIDEGPCWHLAVWTGTQPEATSKRSVNISGQSAALYLAD
jgi:hypothetical protein